MKRYSADELSQLYSMVEAGATGPEIAQALGRKEASILQRLRGDGIRLKGSKRPWTMREVGLVRTLVSEGLSHEAIGDRLGRSRGAVRNQAQRMGIAKRRKK